MISRAGSSDIVIRNHGVSPVVRLIASRIRKCTLSIFCQHVYPNAVSRLSAKGAGCIRREGEPACAEGKSGGSGGWEWICVTGWEENCIKSRGIGRDMANKDYIKLVYGK